MSLGGGFGAGLGVTFERLLSEVADPEPRLEMEEAVEESSVTTVEVSLDDLVLGKVCSFDKFVRLKKPLHPVCLKLQFLQK